MVVMQNGGAALENSQEVPQKAEHRFTLTTSNSTPGYFPKENCKSMSIQELVQECSPEHYS